MLVAALALQTVTVVSVSFPTLVARSRNCHCQPPYHQLKVLFLYLIVFLPWIRGIIPNVSLTFPTLSSPPISHCQPSLHLPRIPTQTAVSIMATLATTPDYHAPTNINHPHWVHRPRPRPHTGHTTWRVPFHSRRFVSARDPRDPFGVLC